ncbi:MAG: hypothetical protein HQK67_00555 [Desulfamplus sp.]|nr:hypothetical protein [Desulfamplus sp.]
MEAMKYTVKIPDNREIKINVPANIPKDDIAEVIVLFKQPKDLNGRKDFNSKINELKKAMNDPYFMEDISEIEKDFMAVDIEEPHYEI